LPSISLVVPENVVLGWLIPRTVFVLVVLNCPALFEPLPIT